MPENRETRRLWLGLGLMAASCLMPFALEMYQALKIAPELGRSRESVIHTFEVMREVRGIARALRDAERGQRGFLITENPKYLEIYRRGVEEATGSLDRFRVLTADNPEEQARVPILDMRLKARIAELEQSIDARKKSGLQAARAIENAHVDLDTTRALDEVVEAIIATENNLLTQRRAHAIQAEDGAASAALVGGLLSIVVLVVGIALLFRSLREVRVADHARQLSEEQFRLLVSGVTDYALYMLDPQGRVTSWNAGAERIKGYKAEEIIGRNFAQFFTAEDRSGGVPERALRIAAEEGRFETEAWRVRKDGTRFWANAVLDALRDPSGRLIGFAKITRDITDRRRQQEALEQTRMELAQAQKMDALGQLTGGVAHDFNNLLQVIKGSVDLAQRRLNSGAQDAGQMLDAARRGADRAASLTQRLLAFSRRQVLAPRPLDANKLIAAMVELSRRSIGERIEVETVLAGDLWLATADPNQLESAVLNLALNARDAMPGGGKLTIETANVVLDEAYVMAHPDTSPGQYVMIAVTDTGIGMSKEVLMKAFEPFFTTKDLGHGTGLGLSQVYGFIKQSNGHVNLYSEEGSGTTVKLYLPRHGGPPQVEPAAPAPRSSERPASKEKILVVEDDDDVRSFVCTALGELGYHVISARDSTSALATLESNGDVDLLFTDVGLPGAMNGRQLADEVGLRWPGLRVLFTTAYARDAIVHQGRLDPGVNFIAKPFTQTELAQKVQRILL